MGLIYPKSELKCLHTLGRKSQIMRYYSYRKVIPLITVPSIGVTILKVNCFFHMEPGNLGSKKN